MAIQSEHTKWSKCGANDTIPAIDEHRSDDSTKKTTHTHEACCINTETCTNCTMAVTSEFFQAQQKYLWYSKVRFVFFGVLLNFAQTGDHADDCGRWYARTEFGRSKGNYCVKLKLCFCYINHASSSGLDVFIDFLSPLLQHKRAQVEVKICKNGALNESKASRAVVVSSRVCFFVFLNRGNTVNKVTVCRGIIGQCGSIQCFILKTSC